MRLLDGVQTLQPPTLGTQIAPEARYKSYPHNIYFPHRRKSRNSTILTNHFATDHGSSC